MGLSFSAQGNRRRSNPYYHPSPHLQPPPPPPPPPLPYCYHAELTHGTHPQPPLPQTPPLPPYYFPAQVHSYYSSRPCTLYGHANHTINRFDIQPYYHPGQSSGFPDARPNDPYAQQPAPPYVEHRNAKKIRNHVNVHKDTLRVEVDEQNPNHHLISFVFDAMFDGSITIFYFAKEEPGCRFVPLLPEAYLPVRIPFEKGLGQRFRQRSGTGIDLDFFQADDLCKPSPREDVFPLVIAAESCSSAAEHDPLLTRSKDWHAQITQAVLLPTKDPASAAAEEEGGVGAGAGFQARVIRQILWVDGVRYELREIYGFGSSPAAQGFDGTETDTGKECVICMTEPKDTAVLPCRHMCMCGECAKALRLLSNTCPICRHPIGELMEIKVNNITDA